MAVALFKPFRKNHVRVCYHCHSGSHEVLGFLFVCFEFHIIEFLF